MPGLTVSITRFVDGSQPGWVECEFVDAAGRHHVLRDKVPIFTTEWLDGDSTYPHAGVAACEVLATWRDDDGREMARITIARPFDIESIDGVSEFVIFSTQLAV